MIKNKQTLLDAFEEKYVGFYRWLLLVTGVLTLLGFIALSVSLLFVTASGNSYESPRENFREPSWQTIRSQVLPLRMKLKETVPPSPNTKKSGTPINPLVAKIRINLLQNFLNDELELVSPFFPKRLLNEWLMEEVPIPSGWRERMLQDLVVAAQLIGQDTRIMRVSSLDGRAEIIMESFQAYVLAYSEQVDSAIEKFNRQREVIQAEKEALTTGILTSLPIILVIFLSLIGLILMIRIELHLRHLANDYNKANG